MFDPALGGGALLDLGVYPISSAAMVFGMPTEVASSADFGPTGIDAQTMVTMRCPDGRQAVTVSSMEAWLPNRATIAGRDARMTESRLPPLAETISIMEILDRVRSMIGLQYPSEEPR
jgi:predicted dehydrogenase